MKALTLLFVLTLNQSVFAQCQQGESALNGVPVLEAFIESNLARTNDEYEYSFFEHRNEAQQREDYISEAPCFCYRTTFRKYHVLIQRVDSSGIRRPSWDCHALLSVNATNRSVSVEVESGTCIN